MKPEHHKVGLMYKEDCVLPERTPLSSHPHAPLNVGSLQEVGNICSHRIILETDQIAKLIFHNRLAGTNFE